MELAVTAKEPLGRRELLGNRFVEGAVPLGHRKLRQIDLEARPPVATLGPDYIRPTRSPRASTCFHFHSELGFPPPRHAQKSESDAKLRSPTAAPAHANQVVGDLQIQLRRLRGGKNREGGDPRSKHRLGDVHSD
jgi:hypothetical protein